MAAALRILPHFLAASVLIAGAVILAALAA